MRDYIEEWTGIKAALFIGGFAGSIIAASISKPRSYPEAITTMIAGMASAIFLPAYIDYFFWKIPNVEMLGGLGFILGLIGKNIALHIYRVGSKVVKSIQVGKTDR